MSCDESVSDTERIHTPSSASPTSSSVEDHSSFRVDCQTCFHATFISDCKDTDKAFHRQNGALDAGAGDSNDSFTLCSLPVFTQPTDYLQQLSDLDLAAFKLKCSDALAALICSRIRLTSVDASLVAINAHFTPSLWRLSLMRVPFCEWSAFLTNASSFHQVDFDDLALAGDCVYVPLVWFDSRGRRVPTCFVQKRIPDSLLRFSVFDIASFQSHFAYARSSHLRTERRQLSELFGDHSFTDAFPSDTSVDISSALKAEEKKSDEIVDLSEKCCVKLSGEISIADLRVYAIAAGFNVRYQLLRLRKRMSVSKQSACVGYRVVPSQSPMTDSTAAVSQCLPLAAFPMECIKPPAVFEANEALENWDAEKHRERLRRFEWVKVMPHSLETTFSRNREVDVLDTSLGFVVRWYNGTETLMERSRVIDWLSTAPLPVAASIETDALTPSISVCSTMSSVSKDSVSTKTTVITSVDLWAQIFSFVHYCELPPLKEVCSLFLDATKRPLCYDYSRLRLTLTFGCDRRIVASELRQHCAAIKLLKRLECAPSKLGTLHIVGSHPLTVTEIVHVSEHSDADCDSLLSRIRRRTAGALPTLGLAAPKPETVQLTECVSVLKLSYVRCGTQLFDSFLFDGSNAEALFGNLHTLHLEDCSTVDVRTVGGGDSCFKALNKLSLNCTRLLCTAWQWAAIFQTLEHLLIGGFPLDDYQTALSGEHSEDATIQTLAAAFEETGYFGVDEFWLPLTQGLQWAANSRLSADSGTAKMHDSGSGTRLRSFVFCDDTNPRRSPRVYALLSTALRQLVKCNAHCIELLSVTSSHSQLEEVSLFHDVLAAKHHSAAGHWGYGHGLLTLPKLTALCFGYVPFDVINECLLAYGSQLSVFELYYSFRFDADLVAASQWIHASLSMEATLPILEPEAAECLRNLDVLIFTENRPIATALAKLLPEVFVTQEQLSLFFTTEADTLWLNRDIELKKLLRRKKLDFKL